MLYSIVRIARRRVRLSGALFFLRAMRGWKLVDGIAMSKYIIVTETGGDVTAKMVERHGIRVVPMHISLGGSTFDDGSVPPAEIFARANKLQENPKTSGSTPHDFEVVFDRIHAEEPDATILYMSYSSVLTCSLQSALIAAEGRDYVETIDTCNCSIGQSLVIVRTAAFIENHPNCTIGDIRAFVSGLRGRVLAAFVPSDLAYLHVAGRLSNAKFLGAQLLKIKPVIQVVEGELAAVKKFRGSMAKCCRNLLDHFGAQGPLELDRIGLAYSAGLARDIMDAVEERVRQMGFKSFDWIEVGGVIASHAGPNAFGAVVVQQEA